MVRFAVEMLELIFSIIRTKTIMSYKMRFPEVGYRLVFALSLCIPVVALSKTVTHTHPFAVKLNASRIIYDPANEGGVSLGVTNEQDYPILVQSVVMDVSRKKHGDFIVTPPLFRLDAKQQSRLRVVSMGKAFPSDRESLNWVCVKGIPPKSDDIWAEDKASAKKDVNLDIQVSVNSCIKLIVRPSGVKGQVEDAARGVIWTLEGKTLKAQNPSPFYINISSVQMGKLVAHGDNNIPPRSEGKFELPSVPSAGKVDWKLVTDFGSEVPVQSTVSH